MFLCVLRINILAAIKKEDFGILELPEQILLKDRSIRSIGDLTS